ncbi:MAG: chlorophyllide reductase iron protein subunit X, partial [Pseudomonadota bacterium]
AQAFAEAVDIPILAAIPADEDIRRKSANYQIVGSSKSQWGPMFAELAENVAGAPPKHPVALSQDGLLGLFSAKETGADFVLEPATDADMRGKHAKPKESLEVIYDNV